MIGSLVVLLALQLAGEVIARGLGLPVPGPVLGMLMLFSGLLLRGELPAPLEETAQGLLKHLSLLFVPAGVGVIAHIALLRAEWLPLLLVLVGSTLLTMLVTAATMAGLTALLGRRGGAGR